MAELQTKSLSTLEALQLKTAEIDLKIKEADLRSRTSVLAWARAPATIIAIIAIVFPIWIGYLNSLGQQAFEIRKLESEILSKSMSQSVDLETLRDNMHNLLKVGLVKEQKEAVCNFLRARGGQVDPRFCS